MKDKSYRKIGALYAESIDQKASSDKWDFWPGLEAGNLEPVDAGRSAKFQSGCDADIANRQQKLGGIEWLILVHLVNSIYIASI